MKFSDWHFDSPVKCWTRNAHKESQRFLSLKYIKTKQKENQTHKYSSIVLYVIIILLGESVEFHAPPGTQDGLSPSFFRRLKKKRERRKQVTV